MSGRNIRPLIFCPFRAFPRVGHGVGQAVALHFDPHCFQHFCNKKAPKTEVFDAFWSCWADSNRRPHPYQVIKCSPAVAAQGVAGVFAAKRMRSETLCSMCSVRAFPRVGHSVGQTILGHKGGLNLRQWQAESFRSVLLIGDTGHLLNKIPPFWRGACPAHAIFLTQVEENLVKAFSS